MAVSGAPKGLCAGHLGVEAWECQIMLLKAPDIKRRCGSEGGKRGTDLYSQPILSRFPRVTTRKSLSNKHSHRRSWKGTLPALWVRWDWNSDLRATGQWLKFTWNAANANYESVSHRFGSMYLEAWGIYPPSDDLGRSGKKMTAAHTPISPSQHFLLMPMTARAFSVLPRSHISHFDFSSSLRWGGLPKGSGSLYH